MSACQHTDTEFKIHLNEEVCRCGARRRLYGPDYGIWYASKAEMLKGGGRTGESLTTSGWTAGHDFGDETMN